MASCGLWRRACIGLGTVFCTGQVSVQIPGLVWLHVHLTTGDLSDCTQYKITCSCCYPMSQSVGQSLFCRVCLAGSIPQDLHLYADRLAAYHDQGRGQLF